ncbi:VanZ family protein [Priestia aryabhattai]
MRIVALLIVFAITYLSNTPHLMVSDVHTWINSTNYEQNIKFINIFKKDSVFYASWGEIKDTEFYLHKSAHFIFYGALSTFLFWKSTNKKTIFMKLVLIAGFTLTDEIHQFYVVGRSGRLIDSCFDMCSALFWFSLIFAFGKATKESKVKKEKSTLSGTKHQTVFDKLETEN